MLDLKTRYAEAHNPYGDRVLYFNNRLFQTYSRIARLIGSELSGVNIDLGSGDRGFSMICEASGIKSLPLDYPHFNCEKDYLPLTNVDFITMNGVIEHISDASHILSEIVKALKPGGLLYINTPNFQIDYKNFYNDPTHIKPYTPKSIRKTLELAGLEVVFLEPALICKSTLFWKLPEKVKWWIASNMKSGSKSIQVVGKKG
jgi:SAM-dependent methyltransferase